MMHAMCKLCFVMYSACQTVQLIVAKAQHIRMPHPAYLKDYIALLKRGELNLGRPVQDLEYIGINTELEIYSIAT